MSCGECTLCCTMLKVRMSPVENRLKRDRTPCTYLCSKGCSIYNNKPTACSEFECVWLASQGMRSLRLPLDLRPDRCGVVLEFNNVDTITAHCNSLNDVHGKMASTLLLYVMRNITVLVSLRDVCFHLQPDGNLDELVKVGIHPETGNIAYMRRVTYDRLQKDVKDELKSQF